jgi:hypothetical protein
MALLFGALLALHSTTPLECDHSATLRRMDARITELTMQLEKVKEDRDMYKNAVNLASLMRASIVIDGVEKNMGGR